MLDMMRIPREKDSVIPSIRLHSILLESSIVYSAIYIFEPFSSFKFNVVKISKAVIGVLLVVWLAVRGPRWL
jgi:hypothetical protein